MADFLRELKAVAARRNVPEGNAYLDLVKQTTNLLRHEPAEFRPLDNSGISGGLLLFSDGIPTVIIPDIHGRTDFFLKVLEYRIFPGKKLLEALADGNVRLLCLGDAFHAEGRARDRWARAYKSFLAGNPVNPPMTHEMAENFALMEMIMRCKRAFPKYVHFLKGNHENILNEEGHGNPFRKFAEEGEMVREFVINQYGKEFLKTYALLEKSFPLCAVGKRFIASHAEPARFYAKDELINIRENPDVILGLSWTGNGDAAKGSVGEMLDAYLPLKPDAFYFGGHRPVSGTYAFRAGNRYIQINNPELQIIAIVPSDRKFDPEKDIKPVNL